MNADHAGADTAIRVVRIAGQIWPATKAYVRLLKAELDLGRETLPALAVWAAIAGVALFVVLAGLVAGACVALVQAGWSVAAAVGLLSGPACVVLLVAGVFVQARLRHLTLPQTRRRVRVLMEILDDD